MILYLPEIYEDETMFSYLSSAYEKGGYITDSGVERISKKSE